MLDVDHTALVDLLDGIYSNELDAQASVTIVLQTLLAMARSQSATFFRFASGYEGEQFRVHSPRDLRQVGPDANWTDASMERILINPVAEIGFGKTLASTASELAYPAVPASVVPGWSDFWREPVKDALGLVSRDARGDGVVLFLGLNEPQRLTVRESRLLVRVATHLGAADRLRGERTVANADAVLSPRGKLLHVADPGNATPLRDGFERRAAARRHRHDAERALEVWQGLVDGRWSIVDHLDTDGKRLVLAIKNAPDADARVELKPADRRIAALAAMGHRDKEIAYILGITPGSVAAALLRRARTAFRAKTRAELAAKWRRASD